MSNRIFSRADVSLQAKGLFALLKASYGNSGINIQQLYKLSKNGRDSTTTAMNELLKLGYVSRKKNRNEKGEFEGYDYKANV